MTYYQAMSLMAKSRSHKAVGVLCCVGILPPWGRDFFLPILTISLPHKRDVIAIVHNSQFLEQKWLCLFRKMIVSLHCQSRGRSPVGTATKIRD